MPTIFIAVSHFSQSSHTSVRMARHFLGVLEVLRPRETRKRSHQYQSSDLAEVLNVTGVEESRGVLPKIRLNIALRTDAGRPRYYPLFLLQ